MKTVSQSVIAELAGVRQSDVANYLAGLNDSDRMKYVTEEKQALIAEALKTKKADLVRRHLFAGKTITPLESLNLYGLHALEQTISRMKKTLDIRNIVPEKEQRRRHAVYALFINGERIEAPNGQR